MPHFDLMIYHVFAGDWLSAVADCGFGLMGGRAGL